MALSLDEALGMSLADETDESIHVGIDTRQVTIPESQQVFGVESDEDVEVKHIVIDGRYNDGTDLSTFTFRVNYQNANGDKGTYLVTELKVNDDSIEFDWVIGRQVVVYKGTIAFIVCAYTIDSSSVIQNEWNSTLGKGTVLEGLEVSEFDFGDDIVRQLASILSDVNAAQASAKASADEAYKYKTEVVALGKEQQAAIEKKGKDTLATIPDDYTQVSNDVSQLKEATAKLKDGKISKFYASSQGNTNLPDSDNGRIVDLKLYGKSSQDGTPTPDAPVEIKSVVNPTVKVMGKNLLKIKLAEASTAGGITYTSNADGSLYLSGTRTSAGALSVENIPVKKGKWTLYVINRTKNELNCYFLTAQNTTLETRCFDVAEDTIATLQIKGKEDGLVYNGYLYLMLLSGDHTSDVVDYEPYTEQTVTLPYTLNAIPVTSGGNVTIDGQQYIADYVDVEKGKLVRMTGKLTIATAMVPGDANWYDAEKSYSYEIQESRITPSIKKAAISSDRLTGYDFGDFYAKGIETGILASESYIIVNISKRFNICTTADEFITWFNESNVIGVLTTPTETDLTADEIAAFKALVSYYHVTNVSTTSDQLDGYTVFNYPISLAKGYDYIKQQLGDTRDYLYGIDLMTAEAYVNSEYAAALAEIEV